MKFLSISLCLAAVASAAAAQDQVKVTPEQLATFDPMAPLDTNIYYAWATTGSEDEIAAKADQMIDSISEIQFRARMLALLETDIAAPPEFRTADLPACGDFPTKLKDSLVSILKVLSTMDTPTPMVGAFIARATEIIQMLHDTIDTSIDTNTKLIASAIESSLAALQSTLVGIGADSGQPALLQPLATTIGAACEVAMSIGQCLGGVTVMMVKDSYCYNVADLYRGLAQDVVNNTPALPASSSVEMQRLAAGAGAVLNLIAQNSIAAKNEDLFAMRPIFAADVMDQYRFELERVAEEENNESWKQYAQLGLGAVSSVSNALEACVRVASNPAVAQEELDEELEELGRYEEIMKDDEHEDEIEQK